MSDPEHALTDEIPVGYCMAAVRQQPRPGNAVCVEHFVFEPVRYLRRPPAHWPPGTAMRWLLSGGSPLAFAPCRGECGGRDLSLVRRDAGRGAGGDGR